MALDPFMAQIMPVAFNFAPQGWAQCNGQLLPINQNQALFSLLGTMYGGDGRVNFALPDLRGRVALHMGDGFTEGQSGGQEFHTITMSEMPAHNHFAMANNTNGLMNLSGVTPASNKSVAQAIVSLQAGGTTPAQIYGTGAPTGTMAPSAVTNVGGSQPHENRQPFLTILFCIALQGVFPSRN
jgi:microcystin-dependent protein